MITWALGWAHYCNGDLDRGRARGCGRRRRWRRPPTSGSSGVAAIADLSLIAGCRGRREEQLRRGARRRSSWRGSAGCWTRSRTARCTPRTASRSPRTGRARGGAARAREGRPPAAALGPAARPRRRPDRAGAAWRPASGDRARAAASCSARRRRSWRPAAIPVRCRNGSRRRASARRFGRRASEGGSDELSERELDGAAAAAAAGCSEREIARELYLSFNTVHTHVQAIYRKLGVSSRDAGARARQRPSGCCRSPR